MSSFSVIFCFKGSLCTDFLTPIHWRSGHTFSSWTSIKRTQETITSMTRTYWSMTKTQEVGIRNLVEKSLPIVTCSFRSRILWRGTYRPSQDDDNWDLFKICCIPDLTSVLDPDLSLPTTVMDYYKSRYLFWYFVRVSVISIVDIIPLGSSSLDLSDLFNKHPTYIKVS